MDGNDSTGMEDESGDCLLEGRSLGKYFSNRRGETVEVIRDFDFAIRAGEIVALIGPSGCGKSTLFNLISGMLKPDTGVLLSRGRKFVPRQSVGFLNYMFQEDRLLPWKTAAQNIELGLFPLRKSASERREIVRQMLELVDLPGHGDHFPKQLSGGMRSRIALARAFATAPRVLLMDEPFSKLDALTRDHVHEQVLDLRRKLDFGCFFITHDVREALKLADRIIVVRANPMRINEVIPVEQTGGSTSGALVQRIHDQLHREFL